MYFAKWVWMQGVVAGYGCRVWMQRVWVQMHQIAQMQMGGGCKVYFESERGTLLIRHRMVLSRRGEVF